MSACSVASPWETAADTQTHAAAALTPCQSTSQLFCLVAQWSHGAAATGQEVMASAMLTYSSLAFCLLASELKRFQELKGAWPLQHANIW